MAAGQTGVSGLTVPPAVGWERMREEGPAPTQHPSMGEANARGLMVKQSSVIRELAQVGIYWFMDKSSLSTNPDSNWYLVQLESLDCLQHAMWCRP